MGSTLAEHCELDVEVAHSVQSVWKNWKRVSGVLCDRNYYEREAQREVVQNSGKTCTDVYEAKTWALKKTQQNKLEVAEIRKLRCMCGVTKLDKIRNERLRRTTKLKKEAEVVWACDEKRGTLRRKEVDGNESTGEKEERKT